MSDSIVYGVRMHKLDRAKLEKLAKQKNVKAGQLIRAYIRSEYRRIFNTELVATPTQGQP